jgi:hypothetical protein
MALAQGNVIVEVPHTTTVEQGGPSNHMQPMHETILAKDTSTSLASGSPHHSIPCLHEIEV